MRAGLCIASTCLILLGPPFLADDSGERLSIGGVVAVGYCQRTDSTDDGDTCLGAAFQPELGLRPNERNELFVKLGFAAGETLNTRVALWAADLEDDVKQINGRDTDHLLTAWYKHTATFDGGGSLGATIGIIDATDYLDDNAYANDEFTQFMNVALVNGPNVFLPSYDKGVALDWRKSRWSLRGVYMNITENDEGREYDFYGAQLGLHVNTPIGPGNYRLIVDSTDKQFPDPGGRSRERCSAAMLSLDQQLSDVLGTFVRLGKQDDSPAIDYATIYSGGIGRSVLPLGRQGLPGH
jgi:porin